MVFRKLLSASKLPKAMPQKAVKTESRHIKVFKFDDCFLAKDFGEKTLKQIYFSDFLIEYTPICTEAQATSAVCPLTLLGSWDCSKKTV